MDPKTLDRKLWDCNSSLYDSFELRSFKQQLDSAINNSRCLSMPHLSDPYLDPTVVQSPKKQYTFRLLRSAHKMIRSVFRVKCSRVRRDVLECQVYGGYLSSDGLTTIPEGCEMAIESPEFDLRAVRKTFSERYTSSTTDGGIKVSLIPKRPLESRRRSYPEQETESS